MRVQHALLTSPAQPVARCTVGGRATHWAHGGQHVVGRPAPHAAAVQQAAGATPPSPPSSSLGRHLLDMASVPYALMHLSAWAQLGELPLRTTTL